MKRRYEASDSLNEEDKLRVEKELRLGYLNLGELFFEQARLNFTLALQYDSKCADAYWGLMLCKFQAKSEDLLFENPVVYKDVVLLPEYEKAMTFASEEKRKIYEQILERIYAIIKGESC
jgi:hypothetical protein